MSANNKYIKELKVSLTELNPYLVLLFGSYASGKPHKDSDIDLIVVTNDEFIPENFQAKNKIHLNVSRKIRHINLQVAVDLLVFTIPMYEKFIEQNSSFAQEIALKSKILYERHNDTMA